MTKGCREGKEIKKTINIGRRNCDNNPDFLTNLVFCHTILGKTYNRFEVHAWQDSWVCVLYSENERNTQPYSMTMEGLSFHTSVIFINIIWSNDK